MATITLSEMVENPKACLDRVAHGESLVVVSNERPFAEIKPVESSALNEWPGGKRPIGLAKGMFVVPDDFDAPLPDDVLRSFEGE